MFETEVKEFGRLNQTIWTTGASHTRFCTGNTQYTYNTQIQNIARGTTDPEIDSLTWIELGDNMAPLTLVANLTTRWRHLH